MVDCGIRWKEKRTILIGVGDIFCFDVCVFAQVLAVYPWR